MACVQTVHQVHNRIDYYADWSATYKKTHEIGKRYAQNPITACLNHAMGVKLVHSPSYRPCTRLRRIIRPYHIGESRLFRRVVTFWIIAPYKYSYLLTFLLINICGSSMQQHVQTKIFIKRHTGRFNKKQPPKLFGIF